MSSGKQGKILGKNRQEIFCRKNKPKLLRNSQPGVYQLDYLRNGKHISDSKKRVFTRCMEHQQIVCVENGNLLGLQNIQKNVNSTGYIQKQYTFHHTCTKGKSAMHSE